MSKMPKKKIAITGTIGAGKSSVTNIIKKQYKTLSSDEVVTKLYENREIISKINKEVFEINSDYLNRKELADKIFNDAIAKEKLENIVHPLVREAISSWLKKNNGLLFVEVPLLYEAKFEDLFDIVVVVVSDEQLIIKRLKENRGYSESDIISRIDQQFSKEEKIMRADFVIYNNETYKMLEENTTLALNKIEVGELSGHFGKE